MPEQPRTSAGTETSATEAGARKAYVPPQLVRYGTVNGLTHGVAGISTVDAQSGF